MGVETCLCLWGYWERIFQKIKLKDQSPSEAFKGQALNSFSSGNEIES